MADRYSVDDILSEFGSSRGKKESSVRRSQGAEERERSSQDIEQDEEDVKVWTGSSSSGRANGTFGKKPMEEDEEDEEDFWRPKRKSFRNAPPARKAAQEEPEEDEEDEEDFWSPKKKSARSAPPTRKAVREEPEEDEEDEEDFWSPKKKSARSAPPARKAVREEPEEDEEDEEDFWSPKRKSFRNAPPTRKAVREEPEEDEEDEEDFWSPKKKSTRSAPPARKAVREEPEDDEENEDRFWHLKKKLSPTGEHTGAMKGKTDSRKGSEQGEEQEEGSTAFRRRPPRSAPTRPRLGEQAFTPTTPEEMDALLDRFGGREKADLDFLEEPLTPEEPEKPTPAQTFVADWEQRAREKTGPIPDLKKMAPKMAEEEQPQRARSQQQSRPRQQSQQNRQARPGVRQEGGEEPRQEQAKGPRRSQQANEGGRRSLYQPGRRPSRMAAAARIVTSGEGGAEPEDELDAKILASTAQEERDEPQRPARQPKRPPQSKRAQQAEEIFQATAEAQEEEEETAAARPVKKRQENNAQVAQQLDRMRTSLFIRLGVNLITLAMVVYLTLAPEYAFPLPGFLDPGENLSAYLWSGVILVMISTVVSGNTVGGGMLSLLRLRPNNDCYSSLAVFACLIQGAYVAMTPALYEEYSSNIYLPMAVLMLLFNTLGKLIMLSRMAHSFSFAVSKGDKQVAGVVESRELSRRLAGNVAEDEPRVAYFSQASSVSNFLDQAFSESKAEDISKIIAPMTAVAALVMALISYLFSKDIFTAACVYTGALCITSPVAGVIASNLPLSLVNGRLARWGATLCGYEAVGRFSGVNTLYLKCSELFPKGCVTIQGIKTLDRRPIDQVILDAVSVLGSCDSPLTPLFREMVPDGHILQKVESLEYQDEMGLSAWVGGRRVLIGNRQLMDAYGVELPSEEWEERYTQNGNRVLYLSNSGQAAAMYILSYKADKQMRRALELLCDRDMAVCIYSTDPNVTAEEISRIYDFPKELVAIQPAALHGATAKYLAPRGRVRAGLLHNGSPASYVRALLAARSCAGSITLETAFLLLSVVIGFAIVTFFAFTQGMSALTWITIAVYQLFWLLVQRTVPLIRGL